MLAISVRSLLMEEPHKQPMGGYPILLTSVPPRMVSVELQRRCATINETRYESFRDYAHDVDWKPSAVLVPTWGYRLASSDNAIAVRLDGELFGRSVWYRRGRRSVRFFLRCESVEDAVHVKLRHG